MKVKISKEKYDNGTPYWLVSCTVPQQGRYKKKHPTELEATKDRARLLSSVATSITLEEMDAAKAAILKLKNGSNPDCKGKSVLDAVEFFLEKFFDPNKILPLPDYVEEFLGRKRTEKLRGPTLGELERFLEQFAEDFKGANVRDIATPEILNQYLNKRYKFNRNRKAILNQFFNYLAGTAQTTNRATPVISKNPIKLISFARKDEADISAIEILSVKEAKDVIKKAAKFNAQRMFVWLIFSGMRPTESVKFWSAEDPWSQINLRGGIITVNASISKTRTNRQIKIQPNLKLWLQKYSGQNFLTTNWRDKYGWTKEAVLPKSKRHVDDICRHTFISYLTSIAKNWQEVELQAGNTKQIQLSHYLALIHDDPKAFWAITPESIGVFDVTEEEWKQIGRANRVKAILENKKKVKNNKFGQPIKNTAKA